MPALAAGIYKPRDNQEAREKLAAIVARMRDEAEREARQVAEERRQAENTAYELRRRRRPQPR